MLTTGVAALCGLIVGWGIRSMRQTPTAQQGASDEVLEYIKTREEIQTWTKYLGHVDLCPQHSQELELIQGLCLPATQRLTLLLDLAQARGQCVHCVGSTLPKKPTSGWQRTPHGKLVYRRLHAD